MKHMPDAQSRDRGADLLLTHGGMISFGNRNEAVIQVRKIIPLGLLASFSPLKKTKSDLNSLLVARYSAYIKEWHAKSIRFVCVIHLHNI